MARVVKMGVGAPKLILIPSGLLLSLMFLQQKIRQPLGISISFGAPIHAYSMPTCIPEKRCPPPEAEGNPDANNLGHKQATIQGRKVVIVLGRQIWKVRGVHTQRVRLSQQVDTGRQNFTAGQVEEKAQYGWHVVQVHAAGMRAGRAWLLFIFAIWWTAIFFFVF